MKFGVQWLFGKSIFDCTSIFVIYQLHCKQNYKFTTDLIKFAKHLLAGFSFKWRLAFFVHFYYKYFACRQSKQKTVSRATEYLVVQNALSSLALWSIRRNVQIANLLRVSMVVISSGFFNFSHWFYIYVLLSNDQLGSFKSHLWHKNYYISLLNQTENQIKH